MSLAEIGIVVLILGLVTWLVGYEHAGYVVMGIGFGCMIGGLFVKRRIF